MSKKDTTDNNTSSDVIKVSPGITTEAEGLNFSEFASPVYQPGVSLKRVITRIPLVKYPKQKFFKAHPTMAWMGVTALNLKDDNEIYLVSNAIASQIIEETVTMNLFVVHLQSGELNVIYAQTEDREGKWNSWHKSLNNLVMGDGREAWIRISPSRELSCYTAMRASASWVEPEWPEMSLEQIMSLAFDNGERIIRAIDHPVIKALRGMA